MSAPARKSTTAKPTPPPITRLREGDVAAAKREAGDRPMMPTPPPLRTIKEGTRAPGEPSLWQRLTGTKGSSQ